MAINDRIKWTVPDCDDVQVLSAGVVGAVDHGAHGQAERDAELASAGSSTSALRHVLVWNKKATAENDPTQ